MRQDLRTIAGFNIYSGDARIEISAIGRGIASNLARAFTGQGNLQAEFPVLILVRGVALQLLLELKLAILFQCVGELFRIGILGAAINRCLDDAVAGFRRGRASLAVHTGYGYGIVTVALQHLVLNTIGQLQHTHLLAVRELEGQGAAVVRLLGGGRLSASGVHLQQRERLARISFAVHGQLHGEVEFLVHVRGIAGYGLADLQIGVGILLVGELRLEVHVVGDEAFNVLVGDDIRLANLILAVGVSVAQGGAFLVSDLLHGALQAGGQVLDLQFGGIAAGSHGQGDHGAAIHELRLGAAAIDLVFPVLDSVRQHRCGACHGHLEIEGVALLAGHRIAGQLLSDDQIALAGRVGVGNIDGSGVAVFCQYSVHAPGGIVLLRRSIAIIDLDGVLRRVGIAGRQRNGLGNRIRSERYALQGRLGGILHDILAIDQREVVLQGIGTHGHVAGLDREGDVSGISAFGQACDRLGQNQAAGGLLVGIGQLGVMACLMADGAGIGRPGHRLTAAVAHGHAIAFGTQFLDGIDRTGGHRQPVNGLLLAVFDLDGGYAVCKRRVATLAVDLVAVHKAAILAVIRAGNILVGKRDLELVFLVQIALVFALHLLFDDQALQRPVLDLEGIVDVIDVFLIVDLGNIFHQRKLVGVVQDHVIIRRRDLIQIIGLADDDIGIAVLAIAIDGQHAVAVRSQLHFLHYGLAILRQGDRAVLRVQPEFHAGQLMAGVVAIHLGDAQVRRIAGALALNADVHGLFDLLRLTANGGFVGVLNHAGADHHGIIGDGHEGRIRNDVLGLGAAIVSAAEGIRHMGIRRIGGDRHGGIVHAQGRAEGIRQRHGLAAVQLHPGLVEGDLVLDLAVLGCSLLQKLLVEEIIGRLELEVRLMVTPFGGVDQLVLAAILGCQQFQVHAVLQLQIVGDLVVGIEFAVRLLGQAVGSEQYAGAGIAVVHRILAVVLAVLVAAADDQLLPVGIVDIHLHQVGVERVLDVQGLLGHAGQGEGVQEAGIALPIRVLVSLLLQAGL